MKKKKFSSSIWNDFQEQKEKENMWTRLSLSIVFQHCYLRVHSITWVLFYFWEHVVCFLHLISWIISKAKNAFFFFEGGEREVNSFGSFFINLLYNLKTRHTTFLRNYLIFENSFDWNECILWTLETFAF